MPKLSRNQLFLKSFDDFMVSMSDLYYPTMSDWSIVEKLEKTKGKKAVHMYDLNIPKNKILAHIDVEYTDNNGVKQPPGELLTEQEVPLKVDFENYLSGYFGEFILQNHKKDIVSFVSCINTTETEDGELKTTIIVKYYKSHIPYPCSQRSNSQWREHCSQLENEISRLNEYIREINDNEYMYKKRISSLKRRMLNERTNSRLKMYDIMHKMEGKIIQMYSNLIEKVGDEAKEECPVCYESIRTDGIAVPKCCHFICLECYDKCDSCPLCRTDYCL